MTHTLGNAACVHKQMKLVMWEGAVAGPPIPKMELMINGEKSHVDAGLASGTFNPVNHVVTDYVHRFEFEDEYKKTASILYRRECPAGTNSIPTIESVLHARGRQHRGPGDELRHRRVVVDHQLHGCGCDNLRLFHSLQTCTTEGLFCTWFF